MKSGWQRTALRHTVGVPSSSSRMIPESETVTVIPLTSIRDGTQLAAHIILTGNGLDVPSRALCNQVQSIDKQTLVRCVGCVHDPFDRLMLAHAVAVHLGLLNLHY